MKLIKNRQIVIDCSPHVIWGVDWSKNSDTMCYTIYKFKSKYNIQDFSQYYQGNWGK